MENKPLDLLIENYKLPEKEHKIVLEMLKKELFSNKVSEPNPMILFIIGQPGCGKTTFIQNTDLSGLTIINSDDYRSLHKYSKEIIEKYPTHYAKLTNFDVHLWGDELFTYAVEKNYSVLREKAPTDNSLLETIKAVPNKFEIVINVVVTGNLQSLLRTRERYEEERKTKENAKLSSKEAHNKCYNYLPKFIRECLELDIPVNYIVEQNRKYKEIPANTKDLEVLEKLREESNTQVLLECPERIKKIKKDMTNRKAPEEEWEELKKIEKVYLEIKNKEKRA